MHYFCPTTGVRLIAPGISVNAGGTVPEHDGSDAHEAACVAAHVALNAAKLGANEHAPSTDAVAKAQQVALTVATEPAAKPITDAQRTPPSQSPKGARQGS